MGDDCGGCPPVAQPPQFQYRLGFCKDASTRRGGSERAPGGALFIHFVLRSYSGIKTFPQVQTYNKRGYSFERACCKICANVKKCTVREEHGEMWSLMVV